MNFRIIERVFSEDEQSPTIMLANIEGRPSVDANLKKMEQIIQIAHEKSVNILVFPELTVSGYIWKESDASGIWNLLAEGENEQIAPRLKHMRDSLTDGSGGLEYIVYGNSLRNNGGYYNCAFILSPSFDYRQAEYTYTKVFLTPYERNFFQQGADRRLTLDTKWGRFGFLVCYDLCFVELPRQYSFIDGADAIITISAWQSQAIREYSRMNTRTDHYYGYLWDLMNASKAAYNQVWSLGANWVGRHRKSGEYFWGGSGVWAPSGMKLLQASNINEELIIIRNVAIKEQRTREADDFNYRIDFEDFYRNMRHKDDCTLYPENPDQS